MSGPAPQDNGRAAYILNADAFIFWKQKAADLQAGQLLLAKLITQLSTQEMYSHITGSIPVRTDAEPHRRGLVGRTAQQRAGPEGCCAEQAGRRSAWRTTWRSRTRSPRR